MRRRSDQPSVRSRALLSLGVAGIAVVALAARQPASTAKPAAAPAAAPAQTPAPADSQKAKTDSAAPASMPMDSAAMAAMPAMAGMDMPGMNHMMKPAASATKPGQYPVDPATGRTLINGVPVVGRVFIMKHTDGTVKIPSVAAALAVEPPAPKSPIVKKAYTPAKSLQTRRMRGVMIQATLWDLDHKRTAARNRYYGPSH